MFFGQTFNATDVPTVGLLVVLEGVLSIDNALVLGLLAKRLPPETRKKALSYGLIGAFVFRFVAVLLAAYLLKWQIVKLLGGGYLAYVALKHFWDNRHPHHDPHAPPQAGRGGLWRTIVAIELTDLAFAVDSILAAVALVGSPPPGTPAGAVHPKLWVVVLGGFLGVALMRVAAVVFIKLLERFPRFNLSAYLLVLLIGLKLVIDWAANGPAHPHAVEFNDFHDWPAYVFWGLMAACFAVGFVPPRRATPAPRADDDAAHVVADPQAE